MKHKKFVKQLQALGIQRNDAAAFARVCRIIEEKKQTYIITGLIEPPTLQVADHREIQTLAACYTCRHSIDEWAKFDIDQFAKDQLVYKLTDALLKTEAVKITKHETRGCLGQNTTYRATIDVAMPKEATA